MKRQLDQLRDDIATEWQAASLGYPSGWIMLPLLLVIGGVVWLLSLFCVEKKK